ncbi:MAG: IS21 family transposase [Nannocystaceae bacterium]|nr:IS21 family transposase [Nannocystaceae bacterium]
MADGLNAVGRKGAWSWRTRSDPFEGVWRSKIEPLLERDRKGKLEARTLMEVLIEEDPERFSMGQVRTMQRRIRDWRALKGPTKEVYFPQEHLPGEQGALDFTCCNELDVTVSGQPLRHLLFEFVLVYSKWTWVCVAFSETFEALVDGLQRALWALGGAPTELLTDNLSAATHELKGGGGRALTKRFADVCDHLGFKEVRQINPGKSNENGAVEVRHRRTKKLLEQALVLRGSRDFDSIAAYELFAQETVDRTHNRHLDARLAEERALLSELPARRLPAYTTSTPKVRKWSTIQVRARIYSVPSQLIGHEVEARLYPNTVEVWYRGERVEVFPRMRGEGAHRIDYRHVIGSLVRKPGAFANYRFREDLFPTLAFRRAYDALRTSHGGRADIEYVRILKLAADTMESDVHTVLVALLSAHASFGYADVEEQVRPLEPEIPVVSIPAPDLHSYDELIGGAP